MSLFALYFTSLYADTLDHDPVLHDLVHVHLIVAGCLFWWPVVGLDPLPYRLNYAARMFYLLPRPARSTPSSGMALESQTTPIAPGMSLDRPARRRRADVGGRRGDRPGRGPGRLRAVAARRRAGRQARATGSTRPPRPPSWPTGGPPGRRRPGPSVVDRLSLDDLLGRPRIGSSRSSAPPRSTAPTPCPAWPAGRCC